MLKSILQYLFEIIKWRFEMTIFNTHLMKTFLKEFNSSMYCLFHYKTLLLILQNRDVTVWDFTVRYGDGVSTVYHGILR